MKEPSHDTTRAPAATLEALAVAVMSADASDAAAVERVLALLDRLAAAPDALGTEARGAAARVRAAGNDAAHLATALDEASEAVARMQDAAPSTPLPPSPTRFDAAPSAVERDAETVGLFGEFLTEAAEGLNQVERLVMSVEREGGAADAVHTLFRVFHTIKGTAGFLDLVDVVSLAHETETMLDRCRDGTLELRGAVVDLVLDATAVLRELLEAIRSAIETGSAIPARADLGALLDRIRHAVGAPAPLDEAAMAVAGPGAASQAAGAPTRLKETIKVDLERVDSLIEMIGELVVVESMVVNAPEIAAAPSVRVRNCLAQLAKVTRDLQDVGMHMRMVPVAGVFQKMARLVRDLSRRSGKQVRLVTTGESTEMDRSMVEQIADPLVHMIRNAVDHGLETAEARAAAGKPPVAELRLGAYHEGGSVVIELADDGRGLDPEAIVRKALDKGLITSTEGLTEAETHALIFAPGFSTASQVTELSGRGVGMDVVKRNVEAMRGRVLVSSTRGVGTRFRLVLPLTLAIIDGMLVACGRERYIVPTLSIVESIQPDRRMLVTLAERREMIDLRGEILPLLRLDRLFDLPGARADPTQALVVVVEGAGRRLGLLVDEVVTQQQVVIKSLGEALPDARFVSGAAILSDGRVGLILNVDEIAGLVERPREAVPPTTAGPAGLPSTQELAA